MDDSVLLFDRVDVPVSVGVCDAEAVSADDGVSVAVVGPPGVSAGDEEPAGWGTMDVPPATTTRPVTKSTAPAPKRSHWTVIDPSGDVSSSEPVFICTRTFVRDGRYYPGGKAVYGPPESGPCRGGDDDAASWLSTSRPSQPPVAQF